MARWITPNTEVLVLLSIGFVITVMEAMYANLKESLKEAWRLEFPEDMYSPGFENILKTIIFAIILLRGVTIHIHLASYLLMVIPILKERMRIIIIIWLAIAGFRSIVINFAATMLGIFICGTLPEAHPACFNFIGAKGFEIGCSAFTWVLVNEFYYYLEKRNTRTSRTSKRQIDDQLNLARRSHMIQKMKISPPTDHWYFNDLTSSRKREDESDDDDDDEDEDDNIDEDEVTMSEEKLYTSVKDAMRKIKKRERQGSVIADDMSTKMAKAAVSNFFENTFGLKCVEFDPLEPDDEVTTNFLDTHKVDIEKLIEDVRKYIRSNTDKRKCIHKDCSHCMTRRLLRKRFHGARKNSLDNYCSRPRECSYEADHYPSCKLPDSLENQEKGSRKVISDDILFHDYQSVITFLQNQNRDKPLNSTNGSQQTSLLEETSNKSEDPVGIDTEVQTDPLSKGIQRKIEKREAQLNSNS